MILGLGNFDMVSVLDLISSSLLVVATFLLWRTTQHYVAATRMMAKSSERVSTIESLSWVVVDVVDSSKSEPLILVRNVGRLPVHIKDIHIEYDGRAIDTSDSSGSLPRTELIGKWILPSEQRSWAPSAVRDAWEQGTINTLKVILEFVDSLGSMKGSYTLFRFDHDRRAIGIESTGLSLTV